MRLVLALALMSAPSCIVVRIETPCAESEVRLDLHHIGVRTCQAISETVHPKDVPKGTDK